MSARDLPASLADMSQITAATLRASYRRAYQRSVKLISDERAEVRQNARQAMLEAVRGLRALGPGPVLDYDEQPTKKDDPRWSRETLVDELNPRFAAEAVASRCEATRRGGRSCPSTLGREGNGRGVPASPAPTCRRSAMVPTGSPVPGSTVDPDPASSSEKVAGSGASLRSSVHG